MCPTSTGQVIRIRHLHLPCCTRTSRREPRSAKATWTRFVRPFFTGACTRESSCSGRATSRGSRHSSPVAASAITSSTKRGRSPHSRHMNRRLEPINQAVYEGRLPQQYPGDHIAGDKAASRTTPRTIRVPDRMPPPPSHSSFLRSPPATAVVAQATVKGGVNAGQLIYVKKMRRNASQCCGLTARVSAPTIKVLRQLFR